jgi:hypothetical protein
MSNQDSDSSSIQKQTSANEQNLPISKEVLPVSNAKKPGTPTKEGKDDGNKKQPKSLYERLIGKSLVTPEVKKSSVKTAIVNWFAKESADERAFRSMLKSYRNKLNLELQQISKAAQRHKRRHQEQTIEFEKQEKQLIAWGLKGVISKFHMQVSFVSCGFSYLS